jgi:hypothetical protein
MVSETGPIGFERPVGGWIDRIARKNGPMVSETGPIGLERPVGGWNDRIAR